MLQHRTDYPATIQLFTISAGFESVRIYAFADFAILAAIGKFHPLRTTPHAIYCRCGNLRRTVHFTPLPGCRLPQFIVIGEGGPAGVTAFAIQSATSYQSLLHPAICQISLLSISGFFALSHALFPFPHSGPFPPHTGGFPNPCTDCASPASSPHLYSNKDSPLGRSSDCSFIWRLTPRIIPNDKLVNTTDEPPRLISGSVCPVTGK